MATAFVDLPLPEDIIAKKSAVKISEKFAKIKTPSGEVNVFYREALPPDGAPKRKSSVLLLHGMSFTSDTWRQIETIHVLSALGYRVVAMDLPGFGNTAAHASNEGNEAVFMSRFVEAINLSNFVMVSPSFSGSYALPYIFAPETVTSSSAGSLIGYIPVAPVNTGAYSRQQYSQCNVPVMIVYGENDTRLGSVSLQNLSGFPNKYIVCLPGAGHACYMNKTDLWHQALYNFLHKIIG